MNRHLQQNNQVLSKSTQFPRKIDAGLDTEMRNAFMTR